MGVRVRKRGFGFHSWSDNSTLTDASANGIAITSNHLRLNTLDKVEFELTLNGKTVSGSAIVCYVSNHGPEKKYGLLFIKSSTEIDQLLNGPLLSSSQAKSLGVESAERFIQELAYKQNSDHDQELTKRNQLMLDAVTSMATRLGEMGLQVKDETGAELTPDKALKVTPEGGLSFPALTSSNEVARFSISSVKNNNTYIYQLSSGDQIDNLADLLDYLFTCFEQIATTH